MKENSELLLSKLNSDITSTKNINQQTQNQINSLSELEEERNFWENKLLEYKLLAYKNSYTINSKNIKLKKQKDAIIKENIDLQNQISQLNDNISRIKEMKENSELLLSKLNSDITSTKNINQQTQNQINSLKEYWKNINKTNNIVNHILTFPEEFKQKVYKICTERVNSVLNIPMNNNIPQSNYYYMNPMMMNNYMMASQMMFPNMYQQQESFKKK
jgi:chromosome segregation ATPase